MRKRWGLRLNNSLKGAPVFDGEVGFFPIEGDRLVAYELDTGTLRWVAPVGPQSPPALGQGQLYVAVGDAIIALRLEDGSLAWRAPVPEKLVAPLAWESGWLAAATWATLRMLRASDGSVIWQRSLPSSASAAPVVTSNHVYVPLEDGHVVAFSLEDGHDAWRRRLGSTPNQISALGNRLFVGSRDNYLYCLNAKDGQVEWRARTGADVVSAPILDEHRVYFISLDNVLRALNQRNGVQQWRRALAFRPAWGPIKAADTVLLSGFGGPIRAFYLDDGTPAGELTVDSGSEVAAQPYAFELPKTLGPIVVTVARSPESGATLTASNRAIEPEVRTSVATLPGLVRPGGTGTSPPAPAR
jgi:outer membrane protein assembly factor BamB